MRGVKNITLEQACEGLEDPRSNRIHRYSLMEILFTAMITVLCGAVSYKQMELIAKQKIGWFQKFLPYENGIPGATALRNVICRVNPDKVHEVFEKWMRCTFETMKESEEEEMPGVLAIDGKTVRGSAAGDEKAAHIVSAYATAAGLVIGQIKCGAKSNEIKAIPKLLDTFDLEGVTVTIDAMGAQWEIANTIWERDGQSLLQVKGNQKYLHQALKDTFADCVDEAHLPEGVDYYKTEENGHGRHEVRECFVRSGREWMGGTAQTWPHVRYGAMIRAAVTKDGKTTESTRYFIGSHEQISTRKVLEIKRSHWGIENGLHWVLDMQFGEDNCKVHTDHSAENLNALRHIAYNILRELPGFKGSFRDRQLLCLLNEKQLDKAANAMGYYSLR